MGEREPVDGEIRAEYGGTPTMYAEGKFRNIRRMFRLETSSEHLMVAMKRDGELVILREESQLSPGSVVMSRLGPDDNLVAFELEGTAKKYTFTTYETAELDRLLKGLLLYGIRTESRQAFPGELE